MGELLELFMTLLGLTGGLGVGSVGVDKGSGGSEKLKAGAEGVSEGSYETPFRPGPPLDACEHYSINQGSGPFFINGDV